MREFGIENFAEEISDGENISPAAAELIAYGIYLIHHGDNPDGFKNMTRDDIQIMYLTELGLRKQQTGDMLKGLVAIINKMGENGGGR